MAIPEHLKLQPVSKKLLEEMLALCDEIERALESGGNAEALLERWHCFARRRYEPYDFRAYWGAMSKETFVQDALNPEPTFDKDALYSDALAVLEEVSIASLPESESTYYLHWLEAQFPGSKISDLIYWPDSWFGDASLFRDANGAFKPESELSNEQILAYAMAKSGRKLPGEPANVSMPFTMPKRIILE
jgi:hypothetical protein